MWLVVGLGNPGSKYKFNRHNIGFLCLDHFLTDSSAKWRSEHKAETIRFELENKTTIFAKPQTFMNLSGESVQSLMAFYKIPLEQVIVVHDEIDIPCGTLKIQKNRGPGGHNGLKSINEQLSTQDYIRVKLGVGKPIHPGQDVSSHVLGNFSEPEASVLASFLELGGDAIESIILNGFDKAASLFSGKKIESGSET